MWVEADGALHIGTPWRLFAPIGVDLFDGDDLPRADHLLFERLLLSGGRQCCTSDNNRSHNSTNFTSYHWRSPCLLRRRAAADRRDHAHAHHAEDNVARSTRQKQGYAWRTLLVRSAVVLACFPYCLPMMDGVMHRLTPGVKHIISACLRCCA